MKEIETTIISVRTNNHFAYIECSPNISHSGFILKKSNPQYVTLYNSIKLNDTYLITYKKPKIFDTYQILNVIDIKNPVIRVHIYKITNFLDIGNEFYNLKSNPIELVLDKNKKHVRLLITQEQKTQITLNKEYVIKYTKAFGFSLYEVLSLNMMSDQDFDVL